jgi:hypothetical protein
MTAVTTLYGSFDENQLKSIRDALSEISNEMSVIDSHKEAIKDVIDALYDNFKIPKKVLRRQRHTTNNLSKKKLQKIMSLKHSTSE